jgi:N-acyl-D-amino-acid deacylase
MTLERDDILFANVTVIDGSGDEERYLANVIVRKEKIQGIRRNDEDLIEEAKSIGIRCIDGENGKWILCPGFIDMHAHSDLSLLHTPSHEAKITQGVTTEVVGQDGISYSPVNDECMQRIRVQIAGWNGNPQEPKDFFSRWRTVKEYLDVLDNEKIATNVAYLVPQGNLRMLAMGYDSGKATSKQIRQMKEQLQISLDQGAVGMSSGLTYVPGMFADGEELAQLLEVVQEAKGYYCPHTRSYGKGAMEAYAEMIDLAQRTKCRLHLTHATLNFGDNAGRANEFMKMVDKGIKDGIEITMDTYPYLPGSTTLAALLPSWAAASGDLQTVLKDPEMLEKLRHQSLVTGTDGCHGCRLEWETIEIAGVQNSEMKSCLGKTIEEIGKGQGKEPFEVFIDLLIRDNQATLILQHVGHEENVRAIMRHPKHCGGSDGILTASKPHPRGWGTFTRYLGHYGRDLERGKSRIITKPPTAESNSAEDEYESVEPCKIFQGGLEEAIAHLTSRAANVIGIGQSRGLVKVGMQADLCLFDPTTVSDKATFANPRQASLGIRSVLVNGQFALDEGKPTGKRAGRTIRRHLGGKAGTSYVC